MLLGDMLKLNSNEKLGNDYNINLSRKAIKQHPCKKYETGEISKQSNW